MKHIFLKFLTISAFTLSLLIAGSDVSAASLKGQRLVCLQSVRCDSDSAGCFTGKSSHTAALKSTLGSPSRPNSVTYIVECISTSAGQVCTTGNADTLTDISWDASLTDLQNLAGYQFQGLFDIRKMPIDQATNPIMSDADGMIPAVEWKSATAQATDHSFYALNILENTSYVTDGYHESQKQATFELMFEDDSDCSSLRWDPYGVVFDSQSLEPIPGATVELFDKQTGTYQSARIPGVNNPVRTEADGVFNFVVPDGTYKLNASAGNYQPLPTALTSINKAYLNIYSNIYTGDTVNEDIVQQNGVPQQRNIPLVSKSGIGGSYPVKIINYTQIVDKNNGIFSIRGTVSHPFSDIRVYTSIIGTTNVARILPLDFKATKTGAFSISINTTLLEPGEIIGGIEATKITFKQPQINGGIWKKLLIGMSELFNRPVLAQDADQVRMALPAILNNIDGYAYDESGAVMSGAKVGIYIRFSSNPVYETTTDDDGHFTIDSTKLPGIPYELRYTSKSNKQIVVTTDKYLKDNAAYIQQTKQDPNDTKVFPTQSPTGPFDGPAIIEKPNVTGVPVKGQNILFITIIIVVFFPVVAVFVLYMFLKRKPRVQ